MDINKQQILSRFKKDKKPNPFYEAVKEISERMGEPIGKWLSKFAGWSAEDIHRLYLSSEALSKQEGLPFGKSLNWQIKEILKK